MNLISPNVQQVFFSTPLQLSSQKFGGFGAQVVVRIFAADFIGAAWCEIVGFWFGWLQLLQLLAMDVAQDKLDN